MDAGCPNCKHALWKMRWVEDERLPDDVEVLLEACTPLHVVLSGKEDEYWRGKERPWPMLREGQPWDWPPPHERHYALALRGTCPYRQGGDEEMYLVLGSTDPGRRGPSDCDEYAAHHCSMWEPVVS